MLTLAAIIIFSAGLTHSYLGEKYILIRLFKRDNIPHLLVSDEFTKGTLRFCWHITSVFWFGLAVILTFQEEHTVLLLSTIGTVSLVSAVLAAYFTKGKHLAWVALGAVGVLCFLNIASA
jgi:hypothetical protein